MHWNTRTHTFDLSRRGVVMGVLNVTPDSFSDGGRWLDVDLAVAHAEKMAAEGAEIIDIGGESTRPGAQEVPVEEELRRILPVIERLSKRMIVSVDTRKPAVARAAMAAGAEILNDIGGFSDPAMMQAAKESGAGVIVMHMQGEPQTMQNAPHYEDVIHDVRVFFCHALERAVSSGMSAEKIVFDPGIGFGKTVEHNLTLLRRLPELAVEHEGVQRPLMLGVSRKSFLGKVLGTTALEDRFWPTVALTSFGRERGARLFRVHDVRANVEALRMTEAIISP